MSIKENIQNLINENDICLFMKGTPDAPQCGFSMAVSNVLKHLNAEFLGVNVLEDQNMRQGLKYVIFFDSKFHCKIPIIKPLYYFIIKKV